MRVFTIATVPDKLAQAWLQHLRDFDAAHPGCHFEVMADAPGAAMADIIKMVKVDPALTFTQVFERGKKQ